MRHLISVQVTFFLAVVGPVRAEPTATNKIVREAGCSTNPSIVGPCFKVQGRAAMGNGTPSFKIIQAETQQLFGVLPAEHEIVPTCLAESVTSTAEVIGEFLICPFDTTTEGHTQMVCVESVGEFTVRRWDEGRRDYIVRGKYPGCAVSTDLDRNWRDGMPADVVDLVERFGGCNHWGGEESYSEERRKEIEDGVKRLRCDRIDADQRKLRKRHARKPRVLRVINAASKYEGD